MTASAQEGWLSMRLKLSMVWKTTLGVTSKVTFPLGAMDLSRNRSTLSNRSSLISCSVNVTPSSSTCAPSSGENLSTPPRNLTPVIRLSVGCKRSDQKVGRVAAEIVPDELGAVSWTWSSTRDVIFHRRSFRHGPRVTSCLVVLTVLQCRSTSARLSFGKTTASDSSGVGKIRSPKKRSRSSSGPMWSLPKSHPSQSSSMCTLRWD
mmetsp:Transcript_37832/g.94820  ORF Transcript_37832/g.94820 Transcript_37832/m.94820 type:complete len:206 (-) Transcript_37832:238-855(-)